jgi:predicted TIM-barrel fold metal-dependent hydrolase
VIVDVHSHTPRHRSPVASTDVLLNTVWRPDQARPTQHTWDEYVAAMAPVDRAIVFNIAADPRKQLADLRSTQYPVPDVNDDTAAFARAYPDKVIGFLSVHPHDPQALEEIERATGDLGLQGIKLCPNYQNFDPLGEESLRVCRRAEELRLPVLFHQGTSPIQFADLDWAHPRHIDRLAMACPQLRIVLAHMGHPWQADCIAVVRKHPHVYADVSAQFYRPWSYYNTFRLATEWNVLPKLLFGSDFPVATPAETMEGLQRVNDVVEGTKLPRIPDDAMTAILHRDTLNLLSLE